MDTGYNNIVHNAHNNYYDAVCVRLQQCMHYQPYYFFFASMQFCQSTRTSNAGKKHRCMHINHGPFYWWGDHSWIESLLSFLQTWDNPWKLMKVSLCWQFDLVITYYPSQNHRVCFEVVLYPPKMYTSTLNKSYFRYLNIIYWGLCFYKLCFPHWGHIRTQNDERDTYRERVSRSLSTLATILASGLRIMIDHRAYISIDRMRLTESGKARINLVFHKKYAPISELRLITSVYGMYKQYLGGRLLRVTLVAPC